MLTAFVLLGHWFEMRARGGANDAIRTLLDLAPPMATVIRDGVEVDVPTSEVLVGELLLHRRARRSRSTAIVREGQSEIDESMVTGGVMPVAKSAGSEVIGASINTTGTLRVAGHEGRLGHCPGADRGAGAAGAELARHPASDSPIGRVLAGAGRRSSAARRPSPCGC